MTPLSLSTAPAVGRVAAAFRAWARLMRTTRTRRERIVQFPMAVKAVADRPGGVRRITFTAPEFATLRRGGPDASFCLLMPPVGSPSGRPIELPDAHAPSLRGALARMPAAARPTARWYTIRAHRPDDWEIDVDIVAPGPPGAGAAWGARAQVGGMAGFRLGGSLFPCTPVAGPLLLVADESALPALAAILDSLHGSVDDVRVHVEVREPGLLQGYDLPGASTVHVRGESEPGSVLLDALWEARLHDVAFAWVGGESELACGARRTLILRHGLARRRIASAGYWRLGETASEPLGRSADLRSARQSA